MFVLRWSLRVDVANERPDLSAIGKLDLRSNQSSVQVFDGKTFYRPNEHFASSVIIFELPKQDSPRSRQYRVNQTALGFSFMESAGINAQFEFRSTAVN